MAAGVGDRADEENAFAWRLYQFERLGYPTAVAAELALSMVDWRDLERLLERGCPPELARAIAE
jgi:hypothetical protein